MLYIRSSEEGEWAYSSWGASWFSIRDDECPYEDGEQEVDGKFECACFDDHDAYDYFEWDVDAESLRCAGALSTLELQEILKPGSRSN